MGANSSLLLDFLHGSSKSSLAPLAKFISLALIINWTIIIKPLSVCIVGLIVEEEMEEKAAEEEDKSFNWTQDATFLGGNKSLQSIK